MQRVKKTHSIPQHIFQDIKRRRTSSNMSEKLFEENYYPHHYETQEKNQKHVTFDDILCNLGFGRYQILFYAIMVTLGMAEGSQVTVFTLMIPILKEQWGVPDYLNSMSASIVFVGCLLGSLIAGQFADKIGRRLPFIFTTGVTAVLTFMTAFSQNIYQLVILRGIIGILVGFFGPLGVTYTSEFTPSHSRGRFMSIVQISVAFGQLFGLFVGYATLDPDLQSGNWRKLIIGCSIPGFLSWVGGYFFLDESALFCLSNKQYDKCFQILDRISRINNRNESHILNDQQKQDLLEWSKVHHQNNTLQKGSVKSLFSEKYFTISCITWFNWFALSFIYYGIIVMMPYMLSQMPQKYKDNKLFGDDIMLLAIQGISDMIGASIASYLIEVPGFGRKNSMILFFLLSGFTSAFIYYYQGFNFQIFALLDRFFLSMTFVFAYQYTSEIYPTNIRTTGVGIANAVGRLGGVIMPFVSMYLSGINIFLPFVLYCIIAFISAIIDTQIKTDTIGKQLDSD